jgi:hypothetical protein
MSPVGRRVPLGVALAARQRTAGRWTNGPSGPAPSPVRPALATEVERFNREQPPAPIPARARPPAVPGLVAAAALGYRVIRRLD